MSVILFRGKYVKPLIELMNEKGNHIFLVEFISGRRELAFKITIPILTEMKYKQIVITKKEYQKIIALLPLIDKPIEVFEMVYPNYFE